MSVQQSLTKFGLSEKEACIYVSLVESGPATISTIAKDTGLHRPIIYKTLPGLLRHGLISSSPKGKLTQYIAEPPEKLSQMAKSAQESLEKDIIPELSGLFRTHAKKPAVKVLSGAEGIAFALEDKLTHLKRGDTYYRYSSIKNETYKSEKYLPKDYKKRSEAKSLERMVIVSENIRSAMKPDMGRIEKIIPAKYDLFDDNVVQYIYGDRVSLVDYNTETAVIIENPTLAKFQKKLFKLLYSKL